MVIFGEKANLKVYVNQYDSVSDIEIPSPSMISFVFSSWIINEFHNISYQLDVQRKTISKEKQDRMKLKQVRNFAWVNFCYRCNCNWCSCFMHFKTFVCLYQSLKGVVTQERDKWQKECVSCDYNRPFPFWVKFWSRQVWTQISSQLERASQN